MDKSDVKPARNTSCRALPGGTLQGNPQISVEEGRSFTPPQFVIPRSYTKCYQAIMDWFTGAVLDPSQPFPV